MAMMPCRVCNKRLAPDASDCPRCGTPDPFGNKDRKSKQIRLGRMVALLVAVVGIWWLFNGGIEGAIHSFFRR
jgi:hypothetical protein